MKRPKRRVKSLEDGCKWIGEVTEKKGPRKFYGAVELEPFEGENGDNFEVHVGSYVEVIPDNNDNSIGGMEELPNGDSRVFVLEVENIFEFKGGKFCSGRWFYTIYDTALKVRVDGAYRLPMEEWMQNNFDARELYLVDDKQKFDSVISLNSIIRVVSFQFVNPKLQMYPPPESFDYWCRMSHNQKHLTFRDHFEPGCDTEGTVPEKSGPEVLKVLDVFCGCGGLSFIGSNEFEPQGTKVEVAYAVDHWQDAVASFRLNHPRTKAFRESAEDFLIKCKAVYDEFCKTAGPSKKRGKYEEELVDVVMDKTEIKGFKAKCGIVINKDKLSEDEFVQCLWSLRESKAIPFPGDVDVVVGGPPCQDVSSANLHSHKSPILRSSGGNNYQLKVFYNIIEHFKPKYALMENVTSIFVREGGMYLKFAIMRLLMMGYQSRTAVLSPRCYGAPQTRWRCFLWGALSGSSQLPSFPEPTFKMGPFTRNGALRGAKSCIISPPEDNDEGLYPPTLIWDALEDLPEVSNWTLVEEFPYRMEAKRPFQVFMRRKLTSSPDEKNIRKRSKVLGKVYNKRARHLRTIVNGEFGLSHLGKEVSRKIGKYEWEVVNAHLGNLSPEEKVAKKKWLRAERHAGNVRIGEEVLSAIEEVEMKMTKSYENVVTDQIPIACKAPYYQTINMIPKVTMSCISMLPGVVTNADGSICVGNLHKNTTDKERGCKGGGTVDMECRKRILDVDHWRGAQLEDCDAKCHVSPTGHLLIPRWCVTTFNKRMSKRCTPSITNRIFGRLNKDGYVSTLTTLGYIVSTQVLIHPEQNRTLTIREYARLQGFPDNYLFISIKDEMKANVESRIKQIGNSVSPVVASALGHCLCIAANRQCDPSDTRVHAPNLEMTKAMEGRIDLCYAREQDKIEDKMEDCNIHDCQEQAAEYSHEDHTTNFMK